MAFLWLLGVAMAVLLQVELAAVRKNEDELLAKENARLALMVALGRLQEYAGRDDRVTALADLLPETHPDNRHWTGVWQMGEDGEPLGWLVSGRGADPSRSYRHYEQAVCLVGPGSVAEEGEEVHVPLEVVNGQGAIAYWIGDEGVKVSLSPWQSFPVGEPGWLKHLAEPERKRMSQIVPDGTGVEALLRRRGIIRESGGKFLDREPVMLSDLYFLPEADAVSVKPLFHLITPESLGVLSRTDGLAGLRHDLSLEPELLGEGFRAYSRYGDYLVSPGEDVFLTKEDADLRRIYRLVAPESLDYKVGDVVHSVHPVLTDLGIQFTIKPDVRGQGIALASQMAVELWNPYTSALLMEELELQVSGLETVEVELYDKGNPIQPVMRFSVDLSEMLGDPYCVRLSARQYKSSPLYKEDSVDGRLFGPGRLLYWTGPGQATNTSTDEGYANYGDNSSSNTRWEKSLNIDLPGDPRSLLVAYRMPETKLQVRLVRVETGEVLCEYRDFVFEAMDTDPAARLMSEWASNGFFGFQFRLMECGHTFLDDPSLWLKRFDPRDPVPTFSAGGPAHYVPNEKVLGANPDALSQNLKLRQNVGAEDRFLLDKPLSKGKVSVGADRNPMLFELPRQPLLSLGQLQHLQVAGFPPYAYGNSWGHELNRIFDTAFFSGVAPEMLGDWNPVSGAPPHPRLRGVRMDGVALPESESMRFGGEHSAFFWMVDGVFNINSTSVEAWECLLSSLRWRDFTCLEYDPDWTDDIQVEGRGVVLDEAENGYPPVFVRFPQSIQEHFAHTHDPTVYSGRLDSAPDHYHFFRAGYRFLAERTGLRNGATDWSTDGRLCRELAETIVRKLKTRGRPFTSLRQFLSAESAEGGSLLETSLKEAADGEILNRYLANPSGNIRMVKPYERSPAHCSQADMMTALAPVVSVRSDTFLIRFYGDVRDPIDGRIRARAYGEARVQRCPVPVDARGEKTWEDWSRADTPLGRQFRVVSFRWLRAEDV